jgi:hypothetical protein
MANGNNEVIKKLRDVIEKGGNIDANTRDVLLFSAIIDIYEKVAALEKQYKTMCDETRPVLIFYKVGLWLASALGILFVGLLFGIFTGQIEVIFK